MSKTITIPKAGDLALVIEHELHKLPSESLHNHFHQLSERAAEIQEEVSALSLASLLLCALELEHIKGVTKNESVTPWKKWVKDHCDFSYETSARYAKALRCAKDGLIKGLDPGLIPETAPSQMGKDELQDTCRTFAEALRGLGGRRQLYLQLEIISLPGGKKPKPGDGAGADPAPSVPSESDDIEALFVKPLRPLTRLFEQRKHLKLQPAQARELEGILKSYLDDLKLIR